MLQSVEALSLPVPVPNDDEDTAWALSTAHAMWNRGERSEAVKWLRRAAEAASEVEADDRALELAKAAADLTGQISVDGVEPAAPPAMEPSSPPPASLAAVPLSEQLTVPPGAPAWLTGPAEPALQLPQPVLNGKIEAEPTLLGPPVYLGGLDPAPVSSAQPLTPVFGMLASSPSSTAMLSADSTSPMSATFSDSGRDRGLPARTSQALHAALYRDETGALRIAPHGSAVPFGAMAVIVVAVDPSSDLAAFMR